jgi:large-conductance mechanosensitive channel
MEVFRVLLLIFGILTLFPGTMLFITAIAIGPLIEAAPAIASALVNLASLAGYTSANAAQAFSLPSYQLLFFGGLGLFIIGLLSTIAYDPRGRGEFYAGMIILLSASIPAAVIGFPLVSFPNEIAQTIQSYNLNYTVTEIYASGEKLIAYSVMLAFLAIILIIFGAIEHKRTELKRKREEEERKKEEEAEKEYQMIQLVQTLIQSQTSQPNQEQQKQNTQQTMQPTQPNQPSQNNNKNQSDRANSIRDYLKF